MIKEKWRAVVLAVAPIISQLRRGVRDEQPWHEWQCPACGATTRARMADHEPPKAPSKEEPS